MDTVAALDLDESFFDIFIKNQDYLIFEKKNCFLLYINYTGLSNNDFTESNEHTCKIVSTVHVLMQFLSEDIMSLAFEKSLSIDPDNNKLNINNKLIYY